MRQGIGRLEPGSLAGAAALALVAGWAVPAAAPSVAIAGAGPAVVIDEAVLRSLGPPRNLAERFRPSVPARQPAMRAPGRRPAALAAPLPRARPAPVPPVAPALRLPPIAAPQQRGAALRDDAPARPAAKTARTGTAKAGAATAPVAVARRIGFAPGSSRLDPGRTAGLDDLAALLNRDPAVTLLLLAYAETGDGEARPLSLARALAARRYLKDKGIRSARIRVRALGDRTADTPRDRVDLVVLRR